MKTTPVKLPNSNSFRQASRLPPFPEIPNYCPNEFVGVNIDRLINTDLSRCSTTLQTHIETLPIPAAWQVNSRQRGGPTVVITGGTHGNEPAGVAFLRKTLLRLKRGELTLLQGRVIFAVGNPDALATNSRDSNGFNLNRQFRPQSTQPANMRGLERVEQLRKFVLDGNDAVLDIHTTSQPTPPFVLFSLDNPGSLDFVSVPYALGLSLNNPAHVTGTLQAEAIRLGRTGERPSNALTIECGQHNDLQSFINAETFGLEFLARLGMIEAPVSANPTRPEVWLMRCKLPIGDQVFRFAERFAGFDVLSSGQLIGCDDSYSYHAPTDCRIVMPYSLPQEESLLGKKDEDWFYIVTRQDDPHSKLHLGRAHLR